MLARLAVSLSIALISAGAQTLVVVNQGDRDVSLIDPVRRQQVGTVKEDTPGVHGHEAAASADGRIVYVPIYGSSGVGKPGIDGHEILLIDLSSRKVVGNIDFGHGVRPHAAVLEAARNLLYVTTELDQTVSIIDVRTRKIVGAVPTGSKESHMLALSHDGRTGYTANVGPGTVSILDMVGRKTIAVVPVSPDVQRISVSNDDKFAFTADQKAPRLAVIDTAAKRVTNWIALPATGYGAAAAPDGRSLLVTIPSKNEVAVVDLPSMKVVRELGVDRSPQEILVRPDGEVAYVSCMGSGTVSVIDLSHWKTSGAIAAGRSADGLAWAQ